MKVWDYKDFIEADLEVPYLIDPILPKGGIGLIYGQGGQGKTQLVFSIMKAISEGTPLLGRWSTLQGTVLMIQADMPEGLFQERCQKAYSSFQHPDRIKLVYTDPLDILDPGHQGMLKKLILSLKPTLVVYDTLHKLHYMDENDSVAPRKVYSAWKDAVGPEVTTIFMHHSRKDLVDFRSGDLISSDQDLRGHSSWRDDSDMAVRLRKRPKTTIVDMALTRVRCAEQEPMELQFNPQTLLIEPRQPQTAREWAKHFIAQGHTDSTHLKKLVEEHGRVGRTAAHNAVNLEMTSEVLIHQGS